MNQEKAREFFSAYYEGSLEPGLVLTLEQKFKSDPSLKLDYDAFVTSYEQLSALRSEEIEIPIFLSDRIATRLDEVQASKKRSIFAWHWNWRSMAAAGVAGLAILGAGLGILAKGGRVSTASGMPDLTNNIVKQTPILPAVPTINAVGAKVTLSYQPQSAHSVRISVGADAPKIVRTINLEAGQPVESPLQNKNATAQLFTIQQDDSSDKLLVVVPGSTRVTETRSGQSSLSDFACALSDAYGVPVLIESTKAGETVNWKIDLSAGDSLKSASDNLSALHLNIGLRDTGILTIQDH